MKRILLDTSVYSAFMRGLPAAVMAVRRADEIKLNPVVLGELHAGFRMGSRLVKNLALLSELLSSPRVEVLPIDDETAPHYAEVFDYLKRMGTPIPTNDIWIAACALQHGLQVVTMDTHFSKITQIATLVLEP
jgi:predicted nucleic acid-binding protein